MCFESFESVRTTSNLGLKVVSHEFDASKVSSEPHVDQYYKVVSHKL